MRLVNEGWEFCGDRLLQVCWTVAGEGKACSMCASPASSQFRRFWIMFMHALYGVAYVLMANRLCALACLSLGFGQKPEGERGKGSELVWFSKSGRLLLS